MTYRTVIATLFLVAITAANAFAPMMSRPVHKTTTALEFGFLKELGLEKPSWLPDFGGEKKKSEDAAAPAAEAAETADGEAAAAAEETAEASD